MYLKTKGRHYFIYLANLREEVEISEEHLCSGGYYYSTMTEGCRNFLQPSEIMVTVGFLDELY